MARPRNFDESAVIDATANAFWQGGLGATSVDEVLRATGLSRSSLYGSFGNKDAVLRLAIARYVDWQIPEIEKAFRGRSLRQALERIFDGIARSNNEGKGCLLVNGVNELHDEDADALEALHAGFARVAAKLAELVHAVDPSGRGAMPELAAAEIMTAIAGLRTLQRSGLPRAIVRKTARRYAEILGDE